MYLQFGVNTRGPTSVLRPWSAVQAPFHGFWTPLPLPRCLSTCRVSTHRSSGGVQAKVVITAQHPPQPAPAEQCLPVSGAVQDGDGLHRSKRVNQGASTLKRQDSNFWLSHFTAGWLSPDHAIYKTGCRDRKFSRFIRFMQFPG